MSVMVLDLGTSAIRAAVFDPRGNLRGQARRPIRIIAAGDGVSGGREFKPDQIWRACLGAARAALKDAGSMPRSIAAIGVTSQRFTSILMDTLGRVIYAGPFFDLRSGREAVELAEYMGPELFARTGHWPSPIRVLPRLVWFQRHRPEIVERTRYIVGLADWVNFRLTGEIAIELGTLGETSLWDQKCGHPLNDILERLSVPQDLLPSAVSAGSILGPLARAPSRALGLKEGIPVVVAGGDTQCGLLATGRLSPNSIGVVAGTSAPVMRVTDGFQPDFELHISTTRHVVPGMWVWEGNTQRAGRTLTWYMEEFFFPLSRKKGPLAYTMFEAEASRIEPGSGGLRAYLGPVVGHLDRFQGPMKSTLLGIDTSTSSGTTLYALGRAILENIALAIRGNLIMLQRLGGPVNEDIGLTGGLTRSHLFNRILAAVLNRPIHKTPFVEGSSFGVMVLCHYGLGRYASLQEAVEDLIPAPEVIMPHPEWAQRYEEVFGEWERDYHILANFPDQWPGEPIISQRKRRLI